MELRGKFRKTYSRVEPSDFTVKRATKRKTLVRGIPTSVLFLFFPSPHLKNSPPQKTMNTKQVLSFLPRS